MLVVTSKVITTLHELIARETEKHQRTMLELWTEDDVELAEDAAALDKQYREVYAEHDQSSEDWESIDAHEGWTQGVYASIQAIRELEREAAA